MSECRPEWFTSVDRSKEVLPQLDRKPLLRCASAECFLGLGMRRPALLASAAGVPASRRAVSRFSHRP
jgi:hypothetical protein